MRPAIYIYDLKDGLALPELPPLPIGALAVGPARRAHHPAR
ncbi:MAG: hypothetical protein ACRDOH_10810 [Streptosporangiaceae bacterium]